MDYDKIFIDLESNQNHDCQEARKKLMELFTQTKEQWVVHYMMEYFLKTGSLRIVEVLVKVQSPHDIYIFDRLAEWLKTQRIRALELFCFVVRKHPTWLYKVEKHRLIQEILKLLLTEKDIVPLMSALVCIIALLPIIPNLVPSFLGDLFKVFGHLASWNSEIPNPMPGDKLVHLQLGVQMLFHLLYGMYPCNFLAYLSDFIKRDKGAIFQHTIKPLLETVRVHPMLVTANTDTEISNARWKEMEPHDVVMECSSLSLPMQQYDFNAEPADHLISSDILDTPGSALYTPTIGSALYTPTPTIGSSIHSRRSTASSGTHFAYPAKLQRPTPLSRFDCGSKSSSNAAIWSPYNEITTSGPIPLTPTPSYMLPTGVMANSTNQLLGVTGSSPPEAAVEATPETTPMKDIRELKLKSMGPTAAVANPHAVRAIFVSSQPSSPMRNEHNQFNFPNVCAVSTDMDASSTTVVEREVSTRTVTRVTTYDRKLQQMFLERTHSQSPFQTIESQQRYRSPFDASSKCDTPDMDSDMSPYLINTTSTATPIPTTAPTPVEHIAKVCVDCNETDRSMCTAGGPHIPSSQSIQMLEKVMKRRNRMASYCCNDTSYENISGNNKDPSENASQSASDGAKVRRTKSCSSISSTATSQTDDDGLNDGLVAVRAATVAQQNEHRLQKSGKMLAIAVTKKAVKLCASVASQTVEIMPQQYESFLIEMFLGNHNTRNSTRNPQHDHGILDEYIQRTMRSKEHLDQDQHQLLLLRLQYERYRREIYAERNRRLMGRSRDKRSLEMERDRLREQLKNFEDTNKELTHQIDCTKKTSNCRDQAHCDELADLKAKYNNEVEQNKCLRQANENLQTRLGEELINRKDINYELESLRGQVFNMNTELQHAQVQAEIGLQCKEELARLEAEFIVMGEVQIKCRDRLADMDNFRARDEELQMLQDSYNMELKDFKHTLEEKSSQLDSAKHKIAELQAQLVNNDKVITEQKRLLKTVKDEYEEKFKSLNKKYEVQKIIIMQMEEKIMMSLQRPQAPIAVTACCSPDTDKTDIASSMDRNSPLSTSLASSESLSASLRSTELRNLQQLVETPLTEAGGSISVVGAGSNIIEGTRIAVLDLASSANTATTTTGVTVASAINIVPTSTSHNYDMATATTSHTHPHLHLQQQQQQQQQPHQQKR